MYPKSLLQDRERPQILFSLTRFGEYQTLLPFKGCIFCLIRRATELMRQLRVSKVIAAIIFLCLVEASIGHKDNKGAREEEAVIQFVDQWKLYFETVKAKDVYLHRLADQAICNRTQICDTFDGESYFCSSVCQLGSVQVNPLVIISI